jgi:class 3 adenylate cyclase/predicted ATPase
MTFDELLSQITDLLQHQGRVSYGALRRRFDLDEDYLEDIKTELIEAQRIAADEGGKVLVWAGTQSIQRSTSNAQRSFPHASDSRSLTPAPKFSDPRPQTVNAVAERRQLTVMFCELGKAATVEAQPDLEDWQEALLLAQQVCEEIIARYEGYVAQSLGDGVGVYWGYPRAHEDDARRAVQAGLDIVRAVQRLDRWPIAGLPVVQVRVGIHTGPVIVGTAGEQKQFEPLALGPTPQIAVHLLGVAEPNTVVLGPTTFHLVEGYFACRSLGVQTLRNLSEPIERYLVLSESGARHRLEAAMMTGFTPFLGREEESNLLLKRWEQVQEHHGQVVLLSGEPGIGKSRLIQELKEQLASEPSIWVETRCSPYHQQSVLYPVIDYIQRSLQFGREETEDGRRQKLERAMTRAHLEDAIPLFANLLSLPSSPSVYSTMTPQRQHEKLLQVIVSWFLSLTRHKPVLTVWEDLHWADPSTVTLLQLLLEQLPTARILAVFTFRPEFIPPWSPRSHTTSLVLGRLGSRDVERMIENIAKGKALPGEVTEQIVNKTDGVPLFVEELTKMVLESGLVKEEGGTYHLVGPLPPLAIPTTLQDSLLARLDRLASAREVAQVGAVLGREFAPEVLHAVLGGDEDTLSHALEQLVAAEVLHRRGIAPRIRYVFKHALIQDVAYQSLVRGKRQQYHQQIARVYEERFPDVKKTQPELIAHHYTEAGATTLAVPAWQEAGQSAIEQSAFVEAIGHLNKGIVVLKTLPETPDRDQQELQLQAMLGPTLMVLKGYSALEVEKTYARALALCRRIGDTPRLFQVLLGLALFYLARGALLAARELGEQCLSSAQHGDKPARLLQARTVLANILFYQGEFAQAEEHLREGIALYATVQPPVQPRALQDPGVSALPALLSWTLWCLGYPDSAARKSEEALALAERLERPLSQAIATVFASGVRTLRREGPAAFQYSERAMTLATEQGFSLWTAYGIIMQGSARGQHANYDEGISQIRQGLVMVREMGADLVQSWFLLMLAETCKNAGKIADGLAAIAEALNIVENNGERAFVAELYRIKGELTLAQSSVQSLKPGGQEGQKTKISDSQSLDPKSQSEAEACFRKAIDIARQQRAKSFELRAVMSLVRLRQHQAQDLVTRSTYHNARTALDDSLKMLSDIYQWFTEGFDTRDMQEAKTLLGEVG